MAIPGVQQTQRSHIYIYRGGNEVVKRLEK